jgi:PKD repeat protein
MRTLTVKIVLLTVLLGLALSCGGGGGQSGSIVAAPTVSLAASPDPDAVGQASILTWSSQNAMSCSASGGWSGSQPTAGTTTTTQSAPGTYTYSLTCTGAGGSKSQSVSLVVFATDVTINGSLVWGADLSFVADLTVSGSGTAGGTLHVEGSFEALGPVGTFKISGMLGGRQAAVLVPEA